MKEKTKKVAVALSGGVDSSVAAALLKKQGACPELGRRVDVIGFHLRFWKAKRNISKNKETENRVKKIGKALAIPIKFFDVKESFKELVENYFLQEMKSGRTPNLCVLCNKEIKFKFLLEKAKKLGCDFLATGHYVRLKPQFSIFNFQFSNKKEKNIKLLRAKCKEKDQTYFLWKLGQKELKKVLFPIGEIESKQKVRQLAKQLNLPTFQTPSSSDACFLGSLDFNSFLRKKLGKRKGKIIDKQGDILGEHQGLWFYTIGQRKGIALPAVASAKAGVPWYVVDKDVAKNTLIVSQSKKDLLQKELIAENINWISKKPPKLPLRIKAKIRYNSPLMKAVVKKSRNKYKIIFDKPQRAITPGQSVVWYQGDELLAGGIIKN